MTENSTKICSRKSILENLRDYGKSCDAKAYTILFVIILLFSFAIRVAYISKVPNGLFNDEDLMGYEAYSLLKTGHDRHGNFLPLYIPDHGTSFSPLPLYSLIPFIWLFDLSAFSIRLSSVIWGVLTVAGTYLLAKEFFDRKAALISSFLVSISPWAFFFSRFVGETEATPPFIIFGTLLIAKGVKKSSKFMLFSGSTILAVSTFTYGTAKLFSPIFFLGLILIYHSFFRKNFRILIAMVAVFSLVLTPVLYSSFFGIGNARFDQVSILNKDASENFLRKNKDYRQNLESLSLANSTYVIYTMNFIDNYLKHVSLDFLFIDGNPIPFRKNWGFGKLYLFELPLIAGGIILMFKRRSETDKILLLWLFLSPIAASLTKDSPNAARAFLGVPAFQIISGFFLMKLYDIYKIHTSRDSYLLKILVCFLAASLLCLMLSNIMSYFYSYFVLYPQEEWYDEGYYQAFEYAQDNSEKYDRIFIAQRIAKTNDLSHVLFSLKYDPTAYLMHNSSLEELYDYNSQGKYKVCNIEKCPRAKGRFLYIDNINAIEEIFSNKTGLKMIAEIISPPDEIFPKKVKAFYLIEREI